MITLGAWLVGWIHVFFWGRAPLPTVRVLFVVVVVAVAVVVVVV